MTNWGAVSSWVAAGISTTAFGAGTLRSIWNRPQVDWALTGLMKWPNYHVPESHWLEGQGKISNFGDGNAHRVSVHIQRGDKQPQVLATHPMLKPGDHLEFNVGLFAGVWEISHIWVTWTPPPIRRHREKTSRKLVISEHIDQSDMMRERMAKLAKEKALPEAPPTG